jgi:hypothetical protein
MLSGLQHIQNLAKHYSKETPFPMITCEERMWPNNNHHYSQYTFPANCSMHVRNESHTSSYVGPFCAFGAHIVRYVRRGVKGTFAQRQVNVILIGLYQRKRTCTLVAAVRWIHCVALIVKIFIYVRIRFRLFQSHLQTLICWFLIIASSEMFYPKKGSFNSLHACILYRILCMCFDLIPSFPGFISTSHGCLFNWSKIENNLLIVIWQVQIIDYHLPAN